MSRKPQRGLRFQPASGQQQKGPVPGQKQVLTIERLAHDGRGIAFADGRSWFVSGALPGEQVRVRVLAARSKVVDALAERIEQASAERIEPFCPLAGICGGCTLQHMPLEQQRAFKQELVAEQLQRAGVTVAHWYPPLVAADRGYRRRSRLAVKVEKNGTLRLGYRTEGSQQIVDIEQCPVLVPELQTVLPELASFVRSLQQPRAIGHLELFAGSSVALLVRLTVRLRAPEQQAWRDFASRMQLQLWWQQADADDVKPDQAGSQLSYSLPDQGLDIACQPGDFVQVSPLLNQLMVNRALDWLAVQPGDTVLDLFCGLGNFSLPLAQRAASVTAVEGVEGMVVRAGMTAQQQGLANVQFVARDLSQPLTGAGWAKQRYDLIVLDPPRDGAQQVISRLAKFGARHVLYVSCNPATLARDAALLTAQGYRLERACSLDMFSHTGHVEAMALFVNTAR